MNKKFVKEVDMRLLILLTLVLVPSIGLAQQGWQVGPPGLPLYITAQNGGTTPCIVDFEDFIAFAQAFNSRAGDPNFNPLADTNSDGVVNFSDFIAFASQFGWAAVGPATKQIIDRRRCFPVPYGVKGQVMQAGKPLKNVWVDVLQVENNEMSLSKKTNPSGEFVHSNLENGNYVVVPQKFGFVFTPDTVLAAVQDTLVKLPPIQGTMVFDLVRVKVIQDGQPVSNVVVSFLYVAAGQIGQGPWEGITDPSGVSTIRLPVLEGHWDITGMYMAKVIDKTTGRTLDIWNSIPIQADDTRQLVLDIGNGVYHIPEREYFYHDWNGEKITFTTSETHLKVWFFEQADENAKVDLLNQLDLQDRGHNTFELIKERGVLSVLETMHYLKLSGLVRAVTPDLDVGYYRVYGSDRVFVTFKDGISKDEIEIFLTDVGASLIRELYGDYEVAFLDLLVQDAFEISEKYRLHPLIKHIRPDIKGVYRLFKP